MPLGAARTSVIRSKAAAAPPDVSHVSSAAVIIDPNTSSGPVTGDFTVDSTDNWVYVFILVRWASSAPPEWTVTLGGTTVTEVAETVDAQFNPYVWSGKAKAPATGTNQLSVEETGPGAWSGLVATCTEVADADPTAPDGTPQILSVGDTTAATTMTDDIATTAGSLCILGLCVDSGGRGPFTPNNSTVEQVDTESGGGTNDNSAFVGTKAAPGGGTITLGADWGTSDSWASILLEVKKAA